MMPKLSAYERALPYAYALGAFPCHALLDARPGAARRLLFHSQGEGSEGIASLRERCGRLGIREEVADAALRRISRKENVYAALVFEKYDCSLAKDQPHVVLCQPSDMGNLGTILRACLGFELMDIALIAPCADRFDPRVVRASMGALFALRVTAYDDFESYREAHPHHALYPFMLDGSLPLHQAAQQKAAPYALIFGNEAAGLPPAFGAMGQAVRIPHGKGIDSLNLAIAVSIGAYAFTKDSFY